MRAILTNYLLPFGDDWFNRRLDRFFRGEPNWLLAPGRGRWPTMVLNVADPLQRKFYYFPKLHGRYKSQSGLVSYLQQTLTLGSTFLDVGSSVGFYSLIAAKLVGPQGRVVAFEPDPVTCESLTRSARANSFDNIDTHQLALSDRNGDATFYHATSGTASSLVPEAPDRMNRYDQVLSTRVTKLDDLVSQGRITAAGIKVVKIDVEGEEVRTVAGMLDTLVASDYPAIWCEVRGPKGSTRAPNTFVGVRDHLAALGYKPFAWVHGKKRPVGVDDIGRCADVLFERI